MVDSSGQGFLWQCGGSDDCAIDSRHVPDGLRGSLRRLRDTIYALRVILLRIIPKSPEIAAGLTIFVHSEIRSARKSLVREQ
ncbi:hypothetical protein PWP93_31105 [Paraburkholderia sp. A1RI-2L]|uniref:hypothetical protein n=1 Tax=Paraburkholderia sp. A1RI-2L TaxID=3028367 RepID=UPI003B813E55